MRTESAWERNVTFPALRDLVVMSLDRDDPVKGTTRWLKTAKKTETSRVGLVLEMCDCVTLGRSSVSAPSGPVHNRKWPLVKT